MPLPTYPYPYLYISRLILIHIPFGYQIPVPCYSIIRHSFLYIQTSSFPKGLSTTAASKQFYLSPNGSFTGEADTLEVLESNWCDCWGCAIV